METLTAIGATNSSSSKSRFYSRYKNAVDEFGFDLGACKGFETFISFLYKRWFGVKIAGLENIPSKGNAVLFGNHSGVLPLDGCLLYDGMINHHPNPARLRSLVTKFLLRTPIIGKILKGFGCVPATYETATELLNQKELVLIYPEAEKGTGKLFKNRYKLADFHSGFVRSAIATGSPLIPVVTIGGDEIYPLLANCKPLAKLLKAPYFPITPFFPWLPFPFSVIPLPIQIMICVWPPFKLNYPPEAAEDENFVTELASEIQKDLQRKVTDLLEIRTGPFSTWDMAKVNAYLENTKSFTLSSPQSTHTFD